MQKTVLRIKVFEEDGKLYCGIKGAIGMDTYCLAHVLYAAACLTAECVLESGEGVERTLERVNTEALAVIRRNSTGKKT